MSNLDVNGVEPFSSLPFSSLPFPSLLSIPCQPTAPSPFALIPFVKRGSRSLNAECSGALVIPPEIN